jgi:hypothetical protein
VVIVQLGLTVLAAPAASAAVSPIRNTAANQATVDVLPTAQIDGVVWSQTVVGNIVYVGGQFTKARPAGAAPGTSTTTRTHLLSFNITNGVLTSWAPQLNAQVKAVTASPDGTRLYVGGSFTSVNGQKRNRIAAFDLTTSTPTLIGTFAPSLDYNVNAIAVSPSTVYAGGQFNSIGGQTRNRLAAFNPTSGALLSWNANANGNVNALALSDNNSLLIAGGAFTTVRGSNQYGMAAVDTVTGEVKPWAATTVVKNAGPNSAILSLRSDQANNRVYGVGYKFGAGGNFEGTFAANGQTGKIDWLEDCHGDTYDAFPVQGLVYTVSHAHFCGNIGGFPETDPRTFHRAVAFTTEVTGTVKKNTGGSSYTNFENQPSPSLVNWFPDLQAGTYTGKTQAAWSVTGNADYVVLGGEFPKVNNIAQQGLVRMAIRTIAPKKVGPTLSGANFVPTLSSVSNGVRVQWQANHDRDDYALTYRVQRNGVTIANNIPSNSTFWSRPTLSYTDATAAQGVNYTYRILAVDRDGNIATGGNASIVRAAAQALQRQGVAEPGAQLLVAPDAPTSTGDEAPTSPAAPTTAPTTGPTGSTASSTPPEISSIPTEPAPTTSGSTDGDATTATAPVTASAGSN